MKKTQIIVHRINTIEGIKKIPQKYGIEIDIRASGNKLILNHEPFEGGDLLEKYLNKYNHKTIIFNIKEAGIEEEVRKLAKKYKIRNYFLLDTEFPRIYKDSVSGFSDFAVRFSEAEPIEQTERLVKLFNFKGWIWIDTNTTLPLNKNIVNIIKKLNLRTCLVSPDRWGRPQDIQNYRKKMKDLGFELDAVMCASENIPDWEKPLP